MHSVRSAEAAYRHRPMIEPNPPVDTGERGPNPRVGPGRYPMKRGDSPMAEVVPE